MVIVCRGWLFVYWVLPRFRCAVLACHLEGANYNTADDRQLYDKYIQVGNVLWVWCVSRENTRFGVTVMFVVLYLYIDILDLLVEY